MLVRLIALIEIGLGIWIASISGLPYLKAHIGLGFVFALLLLLLAVTSFVQHQVSIGIVGLLFAILLPAVGLHQFPLRFGSNLGAIQYAHVLITFLSIGVAEAMYSRIKRSA
ncbi:MAG TPA: hypothetical protein VG897_16585 [Terriglobales bacterium]|nr:hypothetical protein [Terriglobales bacterium]